MKHCKAAFRVWGELLRGEVPARIFWCALNYPWMASHMPEEKQAIKDEYRKLKHGVTQ